jgi:transposase
MKVLMHDGFGSMAVRATTLRRQLYPRRDARTWLPLSHEQLQAIVVGLPWERLDERTKSACCEK